MAQSDRHIDARDQCSTCQGAGWTWWLSTDESPEPGKWITCRECLGTGRTDKKGRKRQKPENPPEG
jgi:DnaJ-class molecular chaperone